MKKLVIARHGAKGAPSDPADAGTAWCRSARLTEKGIAQARALGAKLVQEPLALAVSSDLIRAIETRDLAVEARCTVAEVPELGPNSDLAAWEEFYATKGDAPTFDSAFVYARCTVAIGVVETLLDTIEDGETLLVVSHNPIVEGMIALAQGAWPPASVLPTGCAFVLTYEDGCCISASPLA